MEDDLLIKECNVVRLEPFIDFRMRGLSIDLIFKFSNSHDYNIKTKLRMGTGCTGCFKKSAKSQWPQYHSVRQQIPKSRLERYFMGMSEQPTCNSIDLFDQSLHILKLKNNPDMKFDTVKKAYRNMMIESSEIRDSRIELNLAYLFVIERMFKRQPDKLEILIARGRTLEVRKFFQVNRQLLNARIGEYPPLYHAVRSGHVDVVVMILEMDCSRNFEGHKSTPMHCAAFYGHRKIITILLDWGISTQVKNFCGSLPIQEAANDKIKELLELSLTDRVFDFYEKIKNNSNIKLVEIKQNSQVVVKKILVLQNKQKLEAYEDAFHGTSLQCLQSIYKHGLKKQGEKILGKPLPIKDSSIPRNVTVRGIENWSSAVFVSPSIFYASQYAYSSQFISTDIVWLPIVHVKVPKDSYTAHTHTFRRYNLRDGEPVKVQWRIEDSKKIQIVAFIFVKRSYLKKCTNYEKTTNFIKF